MSNVRLTALFVSAAAEVATVSVAGVAAGQSTASATATHIRALAGVSSGQSTARATATIVVSGSVAVEVSARGDGLPIWVGVPSPPQIPTLSMVGSPVRTPPFRTVRTPIHEREISHVSLGTLRIRIVRETYAALIREHAAIGWGQHVRVEQQCNREYHVISDSMLEAMSRVAVGWNEQCALGIETLREAGAEAGTSRRGRRIHDDRETETAQVSLVLSAQARSSSLSHDGRWVAVPWVTSHMESINQPVVTRESFTVKTTYRLTYQRGISANEAAEIAAAAMGALDLAA